MYYFIRKGTSFCFLLYWINFIQIVVNEEVFEFSHPSKCKNNEYFESVSLSCIQCDANKNLKPSLDRLRCSCDEFSKKVGFKDGYPICVFCGTNATVTSDGNDCVACNNTICTCPSNEIQVDRNLNGTLLDTIHCISFLTILQNQNEMSDWQLVRKFFFVDNISSFKTLSNFTANKTEKSNVLSVLRYMKSLNVM
ncbi:Meckelin [Eufriesea mexicana]|nr:Meckelin [Eufriesea mexicana]